MVLKKMEISEFSYWVGVVEMCPQSLPSPQLASRRITSTLVNMAALLNQFQWFNWLLGLPL